MGYNYTPLAVQPIHIETPTHLIHLCPAGGAGRLVVKARDGERWVVTGVYRCTIEEKQQQLHGELRRIGVKYV